jgi:hypothetical protein
MLELTRDQMQAIDRNGDQPPLIVDPRTKEALVLVRKEIYDAMQKWVGPLKRRWDNPAADDLTRKQS